MFTLKKLEVEGKIELIKEEKQKSDFLKVADSNRFEFSKLLPYLREGRGRYYKVKMDTITFEK